MDEFHFLNAKKVFDGSLQQRLSDLAQTALVLARQKLPDQPIDIIFINSARYTIPELGLSGMSEDANLIYIYTDAENKNFVHNIEENLKRTIAHEYHHCCRRSLVGYGDTLGAQLVSEGLADMFAYELFGSPISPWSTALNQAELIHWTAEATPLLNSSNFDYFDWFLGHGNEKPKWTGYAIGWAIVSAYLQKNPTQSASALVGTRAQDILFS